MSEQLNWNLWLSIVGTITGVLALIWHIARYLTEHPDLRVKTIECSHWVRESARPQEDGTTVEAEFEVRNLGRKKTKLSKIDLAFSSGQKVYKTERILTTVYRNQSMTTASTVWVEENDTIILSFHHFFEGIHVMETSLQCKFNIYHTRGSLELLTNSALRE